MRSQGLSAAASRRLRHPNARATSGTQAIAPDRYQVESALDSTGGRVWTALQIGMAIRRYGFSTAVADNTQCSSACALAWMSGKERFMGKNAHIGFHAAKFADKPEVSHSAQAIIGAYLHEVGVKDLRAVILLTSASPDSMIWLSP